MPSNVDDTCSRSPSPRSRRSPSGSAAISQCRNIIAGLIDRQPPGVVDEHLLIPSEHRHGLVAAARRARQQHRLGPPDRTSPPARPRSAASSAAAGPFARAWSPRTGSAHTDTPATTTPTSHHQPSTPAGHPTHPPPEPAPPRPATAQHPRTAHARTAPRRSATPDRLPTAPRRPRVLTVTIGQTALEGSTDIIRRGCDIPGRAQVSSNRCIRATSSQRLNLRPTSRSMPTSSNPSELCSANDGARVASIRAITE